MTRTGVCEWTNEMKKKQREECSAMRGKEKNRWREREIDRERERVVVSVWPLQAPELSSVTPALRKDKKSCRVNDRKKKSRKKRHPSLSYPRGVCERVCNRIENESEETRKSSPSNFVTSADLVFVPFALSQT